MDSIITTRVNSKSTERERLKIVKSYRARGREKERGGIDYIPFEGLRKDLKSRKISDPFWSRYTEIQDCLSQSNFLDPLWKNRRQNFSCLYSCKRRVKLFMKRESQDKVFLLRGAFTMHFFHNRENGQCGIIFFSSSGIFFFVNFIPLLFFQV